MWIFEREPFEPPSTAQPFYLLPPVKTGGSLVWRFGGAQLSRIMAREAPVAACQNGGSVEIKHKKAVKPTVSRLFGGPEGIRTLDLSDANRTRSQLRYRPKQSSIFQTLLSYYS